MRRRLLKATNQQYDSLDAYLRSFDYIVLEPKQSYMLCMTGLRGGGKSCTAANIIFTDGLIRGRRVLSNIPINVTLEYNGEKRDFATEPFDSDLLFSFDPSLRDCIIFIDEANYYIDSRRSVSNKNILFADIAQQIRKRQMSVVFTVQFDMWLDVRVRQMMDVCARCWDMTSYDWDSNAEGEYFGVAVEDWSGKLTRQSVFQGAEPRNFVFYGKPTWKIYNSYEYVDIWDARRGIDASQTPTRVAIGQNPELEALKEQFGSIIEPLVERAIAEGMTEIPKHFVYQAVNAQDLKQKQIAGSILSNMGIKSKKMSDQTWAYDLSPIFNEFTTNIGVK